MVECGHTVSRTRNPYTSRTWSPNAESSVAPGSYFYFATSSVCAYSSESLEPKNYLFPIASHSSSQVVCIYLLVFSHLRPCFLCLHRSLLSGMELIYSQGWPYSHSTSISRHGRRSSSAPTCTSHFTLQEVRPGGSLWMLISPWSSNQKPRPLLCGQLQDECPSGLANRWTCSALQVATEGSE